MFTSPAEVAIRIFDIPVYFYGIIMAFSMICGIYFSEYICKKYYTELNSNDIYNISPFIIIGAILGARIYYCILCFGYYVENPFETFEIWSGGLSIQGGILGGILGGVIYAKRHSLPILKYCDIFSFGLILGQIIGRWGNFFNSEAFGIPCSPNYFLRLYIPIYKRPLAYMQFEYFHPTFLYESLLNCVVLLIMFLLLKYKKSKNSGTIFFLYLIMYSVVRIFIEQIRIDSVKDFGCFHIAQIVSIITIAISIIAIGIIKKFQK